MNMGFEHSILQGKCGRLFGNTWVHLVAKSISDTYCRSSLSSSQPDLNCGSFAKSAIWNFADFSSSSLRFFAAYNMASMSSTFCLAVVIHQNRKALPDPDCSAGNVNCSVNSGFKFKRDDYVMHPNLWSHLRLTFN